MADHRSDTYPDAADAPAERPPVWPLYDGSGGSPERMSDGLERAASAERRSPRRWPWVAAAAALAVGIMVGAAGGRLAAPPVPRSRPDGAVAPAQWERADPSLTSGVVVVDGGAEADGIVLTPSGLVATSASRVAGDRRPRSQEWQLRVAADGDDAVPATIVSAELDDDLALVHADGFVPSSVARPGTPVRVGDVLTLLDDQGGREPVLGIGVTVTATDEACSRAGSTARPRGFRFSLPVATAEPGAALVRADGTVVGMYLGGDDAAHHCALPIADIMHALQAHASRR